jgi:hypothetical protein
MSVALSSGPNPLPDSMGGIPDAKRVPLRERDTRVGAVVEAQDESAWFV